MKKQRKFISAALVLLLVLQTFVFVSNSNVSAAGAFTLQMCMENTSETTSTISPDFKIFNHGSNQLTMSSIKLRYYYTKDSSSTQSFTYDCTYNDQDVQGITGNFIDTTSPTFSSDNYLEINFPQGLSLAPNTSIDLKVRISKSDGSNYDQTNDYSFNPASTGYTDWSKTPAYVFTTKLWGSEPNFDPSKGFLVIASSKIAKSCNAELNQYMTDVSNEGWSPTLIKVNNEQDENYTDDQNFHICETPDALKLLIRGYYNQGYKGFVIIGSSPSIPDAYWESNPGANEKAPTDLFYADMGDWSDSDGDGSYEQPVNPADVSVLAPDMFWGRISAAGAISNSETPEDKTQKEIDKTKRYLSKIHDLRLAGGKMDFDPKAFCFLEDDFAGNESAVVSWLRDLERDIYSVSNKTSTDKQKFLEYLQGGYRIGYEIVHAWQEGWGMLAHPYGTEDDYLSESPGINEINGITVKVNYLHLDSCSACDFTTQNIGAAFLFNNIDSYSTSKDSYVYNVTGSADPTVPSASYDYYQDLKTENIGTAFKNQISRSVTLGQYYQSWLLLGDPTIKYDFTKPANECPSVTNDLSDVTAYPGKEFVLKLQTTDPENDPVFLNVEDLPEGATYDSSTQTINWIPQASQAGNMYDVHITAYNKNASGETVNKYVQEFTLYVSRMSFYPIEIPNANFELSNSDNTPAGWISVSWGGTLSTDRNVSKNGDCSASIFGGDGFYYLDTPIEPNTYYLFSGYIKTSNVNAANISLQGIKSGGVYGVVSSPSIVGTQDWTPVYIRWYSGDNTRLRIQSGLAGNGTAWFDDFKLEKDCNLGFEFYKQGFSTEIYKWNTFSLNMDPNTIQLDSNIKHNGLRSARIVSNQNENYAYLSNDITVEPNTNYRVSAWIKTKDVSGGTTGANLSVMCGSTPVKTDPIFGTETEWRQVYVDFNSANNTKIRINCRLGDAKAGELATGTVWFDDVMIEKQ